MPPLRTSDGDLVGRAAVFADDGDGAATALEGADMGGPLRTPDGDLVGRIAIYQVDDGVASPITNIGGTVSEDLHADPPLQVTPDGESARISVEPGSDGQAVVTTGTTVHWGNQTAQAVGAIPLTEKGDANGVATLGPDGKVPASELNITGGFVYRGSWNAATNTPTLTDGVGTNGDLFKVSVAGTRDLGSGSIVFDVGDHVVYVAAPDNRWENFGASEAVSSVNGQTGTVVLDKGDIGLGNVDNTSDVAKPISAATQAALNAKFTTPTPLVPKVVFGTTLSTNVPGMVGYDQAALGDTLAMRQLGGQLTTATPTDPAHAATKAYVDTAIAGVPDVAAQWGSITGTLSAQTDLDTALGTKANQSALTAHTGNTSNPHSVTKAQVGLGNVTNDAQVRTTDKATQPEAEAGTDDTKWMTPLKTAQAITAQVHGAASDVDVYVLGADADFASTTPALVAAFSQIVLADNKTEVRLLELDLYITGAHEAGIQFKFSNLNDDTITYSGSAILPTTDVDDAQMIVQNYDHAGVGTRYDPSDDIVRKVTLSLRVTSTPTGGSYGSLLFAARQQTSFGSPVTICAGSKLTARLISST